MMVFPAGVVRQIRFKTVIPVQRVRLTADKHTMIPAQMQSHRFMQEKNYKKRMNKGVVTLHPGSTQQVNRRARQDLTPEDATFVEKARDDLKKEGLTDEARFKAWLSQDHSIFPEKVKNLDSRVRKEVKFGGLGITRQAEEMKAALAQARREVDAEKMQLEKFEEEAAALGGDSPPSAPSPAQSRPSRETVKEQQLAKLRKETEARYLTAQGRRNQLMNQLRGLAPSNISDTDRRQTAMALDAQARDKHGKTRQFEKDDVQLSLDDVNAARAADGLSEITTNDPRVVDVSADVAIVARCLLAGVPTEGRWPIVIPAMCRAKFLALQRETVTNLLDGLSKKEKTITSRSQAQDKARDAYQTHVSGEEYGGVKNARDWRQKHSWAWKAEPRLWRGDQEPWSDYMKKGGSEVEAGLYDLAHTKPTAERPKTRFYRDFGAYHFRLNDKYDGSHRRNFASARYSRILGGYQMGGKARMASIKGGETVG
ncbi:hypothetical protein DIPPA_15707 [Diplonema papillatum]|nr:hypothetical protein DIPPA_15707 [Diplonema papillatum]